MGDRVRTVVCASMLLLGVCGCRVAALDPADADAAGLLLGMDAPQGISGRVVLGPMCPVSYPGNPCPDQPYEAELHVLDSKGGAVTRIRSGADGTFRIGLRPGTYVLHPESGNPLPIAPDQTVVVPEGAYVSVTVSFDTGIR